MAFDIDPEEHGSILVYAVLWDKCIESYERDRITYIGWFVLLENKVIRIRSSDLACRHIGGIDLKTRFTYGIWNSVPECVDVGKAVYRAVCLKKVEVIGNGLNSVELCISTELIPEIDYRRADICADIDYRAGARGNAVVVAQDEVHVFTCPDLVALDHIVQDGMISILEEERKTISFNTDIRHDITRKTNDLQIRELA